MLYNILLLKIAYLGSRLLHTFIKQKVCVGGIQSNAINFI